MNHEFEVWEKTEMTTPAPNRDTSTSVTISMPLQHWLETRAALQFYATNCADDRYGRMDSERVAHWINVYQRFDRELQTAKTTLHTPAEYAHRHTHPSLLRRILGRFCNWVDDLMEKGD